MKSKKFLAYERPELINEWDFEKNFPLTPYNVSYGENIKVWWKCSVCGFKWCASVHNRSRKRGCPSCSNRTVTEKNCVATNLPNATKKWHPTKNGDLTPYNVAKSSHRKIFWICDVCNYEWQAIVGGRDKNCPVCIGHIVTEKNCLAINFPDVAKECDYLKNGNLAPKDFAQFSGKKVAWSCDVCGYKWDAVIESRTKEGCGCPACSNNVVTEKNCLMNNFPEIVKDWDYSKNENLTPRDVTKCCGKHFWWKCSVCGYKWKTAISVRSHNGSGCPKCARKAVSKLGSFWLDELGIPMENREYPIKIGNRNFRVDGYIPETKTILEYLGNFWHGNPEFYNPNDINRVNKKTFGQLYQETMERIKFLEDNGYKVICKWGH